MGLPWSPILSGWFILFFLYDILDEWYF
jgi:hypothetical protein